jgi:hypothetical protein
MIVIGVDVHKHSLTAVAVDELGRQLDAVDGVGEEALIGWGGGSAVAGCGRLRIAATSPAAWSGSCNGSGHGRTRGKSDAIDALAIARAALREPDLDSPELGQTPTSPTRPRQQPTTQLRAPPHRGHAVTRASTSARLPRAQTNRRQDTTRSHPLPQTPTRPRHLQHTQSGTRLDIGATLAQPRMTLSSGCC